MHDTDILLKVIDLEDKLDVLDYCTRDIFKFPTFCEHCKSNDHMSFSYKFHPHPIVASYNREDYPFHYIEPIEEVVLSFRTSELMTR